MQSDPAGSPSEGFVVDRLDELSEAGDVLIFDLVAGRVLSALVTFALVQTYRSTHRGAT
jgi:hypothetical protein